MDFTCLILLGVLSSALALDPCRSLRCAECLENHHCVFGIDFDSERVCVSVEEADSHPFSEFLHEQSSCTDDFGKRDEMTGKLRCEIAFII
jgi:hypothetical protein